MGFFAGSKVVIENKSLCSASICWDLALFYMLSIANGCNAVLLMNTECLNRKGERPVKMHSSMLYADKAEWSLAAMYTNATEFPIKSSR